MSYQFDLVDYNLISYTLYHSIAVIGSAKLSQVDMVDLLVIGGGINGIGIATDAAGRGLAVMLCEKDDLAGHTSSASSKLIHGGLRYLEQYEFKLVREALKERQILLKNAPHLVHPLEFVLPYDNHLRPRWMIRLGLFLYDHLSRLKQLKPSKSLNFANDARGNVLKDKFSKGFSYMDCQTDDSRLVVCNAMLARDKGANILTRTEVVSAVRENDYWLVTILDKKSETEFKVKTKAIVNAAGAWVSDILQGVTKTAHKSQIKMVKGSHFTVPRLYEGDYAYILQNPDQRVIFVIPYRDDFSLIGTTDIVYNGDPNKIEISLDEIQYLIKSVKYYFNLNIIESDITWSYSGVRALYNDDADNPSKITREYHLELNDKDGKCPILSVFGGKLTTYRTLAEHALAKLAPYYKNLPGPWTSHAVLPGGDLDGLSFSDFIVCLANQYPTIPLSLINRYAYSYGSISTRILTDAITIDDLGKHFGADLYEAEVLHLINNEWAQSSADILWRRSKLGILFNLSEVTELDNYVRSVG